MNFDYKATFEKARAELEKVKQTRAKVAAHLAQLDHQIAALTQTMYALAPMAGESPSLGRMLVDSGLTTL